jgi:hypothetical protein
MQAVFNVALPVFGIMFAGYMSGRLGLLGESASQALNNFVYYFALPPAAVPVDGAGAAGADLQLALSRGLYRRRAGGVRGGR